jgi:hypothetical protein
MKPRSPSPPSREAGFVLIGVIIFVLALTIIGISLFSLSTYEAQFLQRSQDGEQAFQSAVGGIERAKFILSSTSQLENVPRFMSSHQWNVVSASAGQIHGSDTIRVGSVDWDEPDQGVVLRVTAQVNEEQRTVIATFAPREAPSYYRQLFTTSGRVTVDAPRSTREWLPALPTIDLGGPVWQGTVESSADTAWAQTASWMWNRRLRSWWPDRRLMSGGVVEPDLTTYFVSHAPTAALPAGYSRDPEPADVNRYFLNANPDVPTYYGTPTAFDAGQCLYDMCDGAVITVSGRGCVVWELPAGVHFLNPPFFRTDHGGGHFHDDCCLVIVAGADPAEPTHPGIFFEGGFQSDIPLIFVSNVGVGIQHINNPGFYDQTGFSTEAAEISVYARDVHLLGPRSGTMDNLSMSLRHPVAGSLDRVWIPHLAEYEGLPNLTSASDHELTLRQGTWRVSTP